MDKAAREIRNLYYEIAGIEMAAEKLREMEQEKKRKLAKLLKESGYGYGYYEESGSRSFEIAFTGAGTALVGGCEITSADGGGKEPASGISTGADEDNSNDCG